MLTLQVSGMLWNRSLVIRDVETGSLWSHLMGQCMQGELKDARFDFIPATVTTWQDWKEKFPETSVLNMSRTASNFVRDLLERKDVYAYGLKVGTQTAAYSYNHLLEHPILEDQVADTDIVVVFDQESTRTFAYQRIVDDTVLSFGSELQDGHLVDQATGSHWDPWSGKAVSGTYQGRQLTPVYGLITYIKSWKQFYPDARIVL